MLYPDFSRVQHHPQIVKGVLFGDACLVQNAKSVCMCATLGWSVQVNFFNYIHFRNHHQLLRF